MGPREIPKQLFRELSVEQHLLHYYVFEHLDEDQRKSYEKRFPQDKRLAGKSVNGSWLLYSELLETSGLEVFDTFAPMTGENHQQHSYAWLRGGAYPLGSTPDDKIHTVERVWLALYQRQISIPEQIKQSGHAYLLVGQMILRLGELMPDGSEQVDCRREYGAMLQAIELSGAPGQTA
jgi:hypothetical protein